MKNKPLLLLDLGNQLSPNATHLVNELKHEVALKALNSLGYHAMAIGPNDLGQKYQFLDNRCTDSQVPMIAANLEGPESLDQCIKKYVTVKVNDITFGITSVLPDDQTTRGRLDRRFHISDPEAALKSILPRLKAESDYTILLYSHGVENAKQLKKSFPTIDLALCVGTHLTPIDAPAEIGVMSVLNHARNLGIVHLEKNQGKVTIKSAERIVLSESVPSDPAMEAMVTTAQAEIDRRKQKQRWKNEHKAAFEKLKMTPEEFIRQYNKELIQDKKQE